MDAPMMPAPMTRMWGWVVMLGACSWASIAADENRIGKGEASCPEQLGLPDQRAGPIDPVHSTLVVTSMLPWTALEYGQIPCAASASSRTTSRSTPGTLTLRRAR